MNREISFIKLKLMLGKGERVNKPTCSMLRNSEELPILKKVLSDGTSISVFANGFALYQTPRHCTVVALRNYTPPTYYFREEQIIRTVQLNDELDDLEWAVAITLIAEDNIERNCESNLRKYMDGYGDDKEKKIEEDKRERNKGASRFEFPDKLINRLEMNNLLKRAKLTPRQSEVIFLYYYANLSQTEIARILGIRQQSVKNAIDAALKKLKKNLKYYL